MLKIGEEFINVIKGLSLQEYVLFSGSSSTTLTLSESVLNFKKVIIYYNDNDNRKASITVNGNGSWNVTMAHSGNWGSPVYYALRVKGGTFTVNGTSISITSTGANYTVDLKTSGSYQFFDTATTWYITKVVGYK